MSTINTLNHVAFNCHNIAAQEAFYIKHFGFKRARTFNPGEPTQFVLLKLGSMRIELFPTDPAKVSGAKGAEQPIGFKHLAFDVPKLEPALEALMADGIQHDPIIDAGKHMKGCRVVFFRDPEGNIIELMEGYFDEE